MRFSKEILKGAVEVIILRTIHDLQDAYGYELVTAIRKSSKNIFEFQEGTLYPILYRLEEQGLVTSKKKTAPSGKIRRYYHLTKEGENFLRDKKEEWQAFFQAFRPVIECRL